jgi:hypothetical protein
MVLYCQIPACVFAVGSIVISRGEGAAFDAMTQGQTIDALAITYISASLMMTLSSGLFSYLALREFLKLQEDIRIVYAPQKKLEALRVEIQSGDKLELLSENERNELLSEIDRIAKRVASPALGEDLLKRIRTLAVNAD